MQENKALKNKLSSSLETMEDKEIRPTNSFAVVFFHVWLLIFAFGSGNGFSALFCWFCIENTPRLLLFLFLRKSCSLWIDKGILPLGLTVISFVACNVTSYTEIFLSGGVYFFKFFFPLGLCALIQSLFIKYIIYLIQIIFGVRWKVNLLNATRLRVFLQNFY